MPTKEEINKKIAKHMGFIEVEFPDDSPVQGTALFNRETGQYIVGNYYTNSLDRLIPVVEKMGVISFEFNSDWVESGRQWIATVEIPDPDDSNNVLVCNWSSTVPSMALATACYYVIHGENDG